MYTFEYESPLDKSTYQILSPAGKVLMTGLTETYARFLVLRMNQRHG